MAVKKRAKRLARLSGWMMVAVGLPWGLWWYWHVPTPGKGGTLLALVATLMPLVWDDVREFGRAGLILTLLVLFAVEYRAINKEHRDYADGQRKARQEELDSFGALLDKQESSVKRILEQEDQHFKETFAEFLKEDNNENARFNALLNQQQNVFKRQEELAQSLSGKLIPGNEPVTTFCGNIPADAVVLLYGKQGSIIRKNPPGLHPVLVSRQFGQIIGIDRAADGSIVVLLDIRDKDRKIIARLNREGFVVNRNNFLEMRRDKSHLKVMDEYGDDILNVDYMNSQSIRVDATITLPGRSPYRLGYGGMPFCLDTNGVLGAIDVAIP